MTKMLEHENPLVRCLGALYCRFIMTPTKLWEWLENLLYDDQEVTTAQDESKNTVCNYVATLLSDIRYCDTSLPRIPKNIQLIFKRELTRRDIMRGRDDRNEFLREKLKKGSKVEAQYSEDWKFYPAVVDKVLNETGQFLITFTEYDEQQEVSIGMIRMTGREKKR
eukprot:UN23568